MAQIVTNTSPVRHQPIGIVGTGLFGTSVAERLMDDGFALHVYNRTPEKAQPLLERGARWSDNPFRECERVIFSVFTTDQVGQLLDRMRDELRPGKIVIDTTTSDPQQTLALGRRLAERHIAYLEAPVSGSSEQTRNRQSTALVAGEQEVFTSCDDLWKSLAAKAYYVGPWGNAAKMKLVTNLVLGLNRAVLAEGLAFASIVGLSREDALEVLLNSPAYSRTMDAKGPKMVTGRFEPQAKLAQHIKDVQLMLAEATRAEASLPISQVHLHLLERAVAAGLGELDNSAIIRVIEDPALGLAAPSPLCRNRPTRKLAP